MVVIPPPPLRANCILAAVLALALENPVQKILERLVITTGQKLAEPSPGQFFHQFPSIPAPSALHFWMRPSAVTEK